MNHGDCQRIENLTNTIAELRQDYRMLEADYREARQQLARHANETAHCGDGLCDRMQRIRDGARECLERTRPILIEGRTV
jgi:hypothetical protein